MTITRIILGVIILLMVLGTGLVIANRDDDDDYPKYK